MSSHGVARLNLEEIKKDSLELESLLGWESTYDTGARINVTATDAIGILTNNTVEPDETADGVYHHIVEMYALLVVGFNNTKPSSVFENEFYNAAMGNMIDAIERITPLVNTVDLEELLLTLFDSLATASEALKMCGAEKVIHMMHRPAVDVAAAAANCKGALAAADRFMRERDIVVDEAQQLFEQLSESRSRVRNLERHVSQAQREISGMHHQTSSHARTAMRLQEQVDALLLELNLQGGVLLDQDGMPVERAPAIVVINGVSHNLGQTCGFATWDVRADWTRVRRIPIANIEADVLVAKVATFRYVEELDYTLNYVYEFKANISTGKVWVTCDKMLHLPLQVDDTMSVYDALNTFNATYLPEADRLTFCYASGSPGEVSLDCRIVPGEEGGSWHMYYTPMRNLAIDRVSFETWFLTEEQAQQNWVSSAF